MTLTIHCQDCGHAVETRRKNTKYCSVCRLVRDLPYAANIQRPSCQLCRSFYRPLDIHDPLCGQHAPVSPKYGDTECRLCGTTATRVRADVDVCNHCARDHDKRPELFTYLESVKAARLGGEPEPAATTAPEPAQAESTPDTFGGGEKIEFFKAHDSADDPFWYLRSTGPRGADWLQTKYMYVGGLTDGHAVSCKDRPKSVLVGNLKKIGFEPCEIPVPAGVW